MYVQWLIGVAIERDEAALRLHPQGADKLQRHTAAARRSASQPASQPAGRVAGSAGRPVGRSARQPASQRQRAFFTKRPLTQRSRVPSSHSLLFTAVPAVTFLAPPRVTDTGVRPLR